MYAVIKAGGKQHKVKTGDVIEVELMHGGHDEAISFTPILVVDDDGKAHVGKDLGKAQVKAKLVGEEKGEKVKIFKYRNKTGYSRRQGHRQMYTLVEIQDVSLGRRAAAKKAGEGEEAAATPKATATPKAAATPKAEKSPPAPKAAKAERAPKVEKAAKVEKQPKVDAAEPPDASDA